MKKSALMSKKGFTLVELIVVIIIIGVLIAVAIPNLLPLVTNANSASTDVTDHYNQILTASRNLDSTSSDGEWTFDKNEDNG